MSQFKELITIELINSLGLLRSFSDRDEAGQNPEMNWAESTAERIENLFNSQYVPFVSEVEEFNSLMNKVETSLRFWTLCVTLLMFPLGTVLCFMALRIKFGPLIWKCRRRIYQKLALHKKRHKRLLKHVPKNKARHVTMNKLLVSMLYIVAETVR
jgi:hypothetical protein